MLLKFQLDWIKIVDFLLAAKFKARLLFFTRTLDELYDSAISVCPFKLFKYCIFDMWNVPKETFIFHKRLSE